MDGSEPLFGGSQSQWTQRGAHHGVSHDA
jgi:hypothetical protein